MIQNRQMQSCLQSEHHSYRPGAGLQCAVDQPAALEALPDVGPDAHPQACQIWFCFQKLSIDILLK